MTTERRVNEKLTKEEKEAKYFKAKERIVKEVIRELEKKKSKQVLSIDNIRVDFNCFSFYFNLYGESVRFEMRYISKPLAFFRTEETDRLKFEIFGGNYTIKNLKRREGTKGFENIKWNEMAKFIIQITKLNKGEKEKAKEVSKFKIEFEPKIKELCEKYDLMNIGYNNSLKLLVNKKIGLYLELDNEEEAKAILETLEALKGKRKE